MAKKSYNYHFASFSFRNELSIGGVPLTYNCHSKRTKHGELSLYCQIYATEEVTSPLYLEMCSQKFFQVFRMILVQIPKQLQVSDVQGRLE